MVSRDPRQSLFAQAQQTELREPPVLPALDCIIGLIWRPFVLLPPSGPMGHWAMEIPVKASSTDRDNSIRIFLSAKRPRSGASGKTHNWRSVQSSTMPSITRNSPIPARILGLQTSASLHKLRWRLD